MNWRQLISNKRFGLEDLHEARKDDRTEFQRDYDRLIFSAPFRRLQNKTQVFPLPGSIFVHNRLTHSLEVSCVGRSLGSTIASQLLTKHPELSDTHLSEIGAIVSAACLAHDLGNPPFGHSGEKAISTYFSEGKGLSLKDRLSPMEWEDLTHFEGNANAFRLLTHQFEGRRKGGFVMTIKKIFAFMLAFLLVVGSVVAVSAVAPPYSENFKSEEDMMKVRNLGRKSLEEVIAKLESLNFTLRKDDE